MGGLFVDIAFADPLGLNGMVLATVVYVIWQIRQRLLMYAVLQQALVVSALVLFGEVVHRLAHDQADFLVPLALGPAVTSLILWPYLQAVLVNIARRFRVE